MKTKAIASFLRTILSAYLAIHALSLQAYSQSHQDSIAYAINQVLSAFDIEALQDDQTIASSIESLISYINNPINLNTCSLFELAAFPLIDELTAQNIIQLRDELEAFTSFSDLLIINSISPQFIQVARAFFIIPLHTKTNTSETVNVRSSRSNLRTTTISQSIYRQIEKPIGYSVSPEQGGFKGSPASLYTRIVSESPRGISMRLSLEKDPGESISWTPEKQVYGTDHVEWAASITGGAFLKQLVLGHYTAAFGQGLLFSSRFSSHKGTDPTKIPLKSFSKIRPSSSRSEGTSFRGIATAVQLGPSLNLFGFYSYRDRDASLSAYGANAQLGVTSIHANGLHRTESEINRKGRLNEILWGLSLTHSSRLLNLGLTIYTSRFNYPFLPKSSFSPIPAEFTGNLIKSWSFWGKLGRHNTEITWEVARTNPGSYAGISSVLFRPSNLVTVVLVFRNYSNRFYSFYGKSFGEQSTLRNETGVYIGSRLRISDDVTGFFFFDLFDIPGIIPGNTQKPVSGIEGLLRLSYTPRPWLNGYMQYRFESKPQRQLHSFSTVHLVHSTTSHTKHVWKLRLEYVHSNTLTLKTHLETRLGNLQGTVSTGVLLYQDLTIHPTKRTKFHLRFSIFDSKRNDTILYAFENDLQYKFGIRSYSGKGVRNVFLARHFLSNNVILEFKYAKTQYPHKTQKSSGIHAISSGRIRELSGQISLRI